MVLVGCLLVVGSLLWYQINVDGPSVIGTGNVSALEVIANVTLGLVLVGLSLAALGATLLVRRIESDLIGSTTFSGISRLSMVMSGPRATMVFSLTAVCYGVLYAIVSSTLVFQPGVDFSEVYGVKVPSLVPVICCGSIGEMPQLIIYITRQLAILIVPENLVILFAVSWLVGLNASVAYYFYTSRSGSSGTKWITGLGASIGLFTICPSCAGYFLLGVLGLSGGIALTLTLSSLQALFIGIGIPILVATPILAMRRIPTNTKQCANVPDNQSTT